ncbi:Dioxygenase himG [Exophiala dermatitidis]
MAPGILENDVLPTIVTSKSAAADPVSSKADFKVEEFQYSSATADEIVQSLIRNGGCFIRNMLSESDLDEIHKDVSPYLYQNRSYEGSFFPKESSRVLGVVGKSKAYTEKIVGDPLKNQVTDKLLSSTFKFWTGSELTEATSKPQCSSTVVFSIAPGAKNQDLHRDDIIHHNNLVAIAPEEYKVGRDVSISFFVAGKRATKANGATRFIPGSHLQDGLTPPDESQVVYAEMEPGDAFIMLGSCYHGGSANTTQDQERLLYACFTTKGYLRQEENIYLSTPLEKIKDYSMEMQKQLGYDLSFPFLGYVDMQTPLKLLNPDLKANDPFDVDTPPPRRQEFLHAPAYRQRPYSAQELACILSIIEAAGKTLNTQCVGSFAVFSVLSGDRASEFETASVPNASGSDMERQSTEEAQPPARDEPECSDSLILTTRDWLQGEVATSPAFARLSMSPSKAHMTITHGEAHEDFEDSVPWMSSDSSTSHGKCSPVPSPTPPLVPPESADQRRMIDYWVGYMSGIFVPIDRSDNPFRTTIAPMAWMALTTHRDVASYRALIHGISALGGFNRGNRLTGTERQLWYMEAVKSHQNSLRWLAQAIAEREESQWEATLASICVVSFVDVFGDKQDGRTWHVHLRGGRDWIRWFQGTKLAVNGQMSMLYQTFWILACFGSTTWPMSALDMMAIEDLDMYQPRQRLNSPEVPTTPIDICSGECSTKLADGPSSTTYSLYYLYGVTQPIFECIAEINRLQCLQDPPTEDAITKLRKKILQNNPSCHGISPGSGVSTRLSELTTSERLARTYACVFFYACLIHFTRTVQRRPLRDVQALVGISVRYMKEITQFSNGRETSVLWPLFVTGAESKTSRHRKIVLTLLERGHKLGYTSYADAIDLLQEVWRRRDEQVQSETMTELWWQDVGRDMGIEILLT